MSSGGPPEKRRGFLKAVTGVCAALGGFMTLVPGLRFLASPLVSLGKLREGELQTAARLDELTPGHPLRVELAGSLHDGWERQDGVRLGTAWLVQDRHDKVRAFSAVCPHLGCGVDWNARTSQFDCPCHRSHFDGEGHCISGPSPRDLDELEVVITGDEVKLRYRRFKLSTRTKEWVG